MGTFFLISSNICYAESTTTTTTNPDGSTTVEETTMNTSDANSTNNHNIVGLAGVTGTIRRVNRCDEYRKQDDLEDAIQDRPNRNRR